MAETASVRITDGERGYTALLFRGTSDQVVPHVLSRVWEAVWRCAPAVLLRLLSRLVSGFAMRIAQSLPFGAHRVFPFVPTCRRIW